MKKNTNTIKYPFKYQAILLMTLILTMHAQINSMEHETMPMIGEVKKTDTGYTLNKILQGYPYEADKNTIAHQFNPNGTEISRQNYVGDYLDRNYALNSKTNELGRIKSNGKMNDDVPTKTHKITPYSDGSFRIDEHDSSADTITTNYYDSESKPKAAMTLEKSRKGYTLKKYDQSGLISKHKFNKNGAETSQKNYNDDGTTHSKYDYNENTDELGEVQSNGSISGTSTPKTTHEITSNSRNGVTLDQYDNNNKLITSHNYRYQLGSTSRHDTTSEAPQTVQAPQKTMLGNFMTALRGDNKQQAAN